MLQKRLLVIYYSQTGQLRKILDSVLSPLRSAGVETEYAEILPDPAFPFPWPSEEFFQAFPESYMGIPCPVKPLITKHDHYDLIVLGYSPWFLSPSMPLHAFMQSHQAKKLLQGKPVVTVIGCRNMWIMAHEKMKRYLLQAGAKPAGNIVLRDRARNLVSLVTIIRWMFKGKKERSGLYPAAGVSPADIKQASRFGETVKDALARQDYSALQRDLIKAGAVEAKPNLAMFERNGSRIFRIWASKILRKGPYGHPKRKPALRLFKYYLLTVLFLVTPPANGIYFFIKLFNSKKIKRRMDYFLNNSLPEGN